MDSTNIKDINLNIDVVIDHETAIESFGGEEDMFFKLIAKFETMTLKPNIMELNTHYDNKAY